MADVIWSDEALDHIDRITDYISLFNDKAAHDVRDRLVRLGNSLAHFPNRGRPASAGVRELVTEPPYILRYTTLDDRVLILSVHHGARKPD